MLAFQIAKSAAKSVESEAESKKPVNIERLVSNFTMDCIARSVFSMNVDTVHNPNNEFARNGDGILVAWRFLLVGVAPWLAWLFNICAFNPKGSAYFVNVSF